MQITKQLISKGYTITVTSCENDGDYYKTKSITVQTIEEAKAWYELMEFCKPYKKKGQIPLGGTQRFSEKQIEAIYDLFLKNKEYYKIDDKTLDVLKEYIELLNSEDGYDTDEDDYIWTIQNDFKVVVFDLIDEPDDVDYACRNVKSCKIEYSPEDVYVTVEQINF